MRGRLMRKVKGIIIGSHRYRHELNRRLFNTPNWRCKVDGQVIKNSVWPYMTDLDRLPLPHGDLIYVKDPISRHSKIKHLISGWGCLRDCIFNHRVHLARLSLGLHKVIRC